MARRVIVLVRQADGDTGIFDSASDLLVPLPYRVLLCASGANSVFAVAALVPRLWSETLRHAMLLKSGSLDAERFNGEIGCVHTRSYMSDMLGTLGKKSAGGALPCHHLVKYAPVFPSKVHG